MGAELQPIKSEIVPAEVRPLVPASVTEAMEMARIIGLSQLAPAHYKNEPEKILVGIIHGMEVGLPPMAALQHITVINGQPRLDGDGMLALVLRSGQLERLDESIEGEGDKAVASCTARRKGGREKTTRFSMADAKRAGLGGNNWQKYPQRMLRYRALSWTLRDLFPDVLLGMSRPDEEEAEPVEEDEPVREVEQAEPTRDERRELTETLRGMVPDGAENGEVAYLMNGLLAWAYSESVVDAPGLNESGFYRLGEHTPMQLAALNEFFALADPDDLENALVNLQERWAMDHRDQEHDPLDADEVRAIEVAG